VPVTVTMLVIMKHVIIKKSLLSSVLLFSLLSSGSAGAVLYRGVDAEGNVVYSDTPFEDAEKYTPPPISVVGSSKKKADENKGGDKASEKKPAEFRYLDFDIVSPGNKETIRNEQDVKVTLKLNPALNTGKEHTIWLLMDNSPVVKNSLSTSLLIEQVDRGAHQLQALVKDKDGKVIVRTRPLVFFVHK